MNLCVNWYEKPRRVFLVLAMLCILAFLYARAIPLGYAPRALKKTVMITVQWRGALEQQVERVIVDPLERELPSVAGISEIFSLSEKGAARLLVSFTEETDLDAAFLAIREIVFAVSPNLPGDVQRPVLQKSDPLGSPVFVAGFPSPGGMREEELKRLFENVEGSGEVVLAGSFDPVVVLSYDAHKLSAAQIGLEDLIQSVRGQNVLGGFGAEGESSCVLDGRFRDTDALADLPLRPGVRLRDVARVTIENRRGEVLGKVDGERRLLLYVQPEGDANLPALCTRLQRLTETLPGGEVLYSYGRIARRALLQVLRAAAIGACCVVLLTFLFMRRFYAAFLISANIPFSIFLALAAVRACGEELNILSLSGIAVGVGLVIDAGVIFVEEFFHCGCDYRRALDRARAPILSATATTAVVFLPLLFAPPILVDRFRGLAVAIVASVAASCVFVFLFLPAFLHLIYPIQDVADQDRRYHVVLKRGIVWLHGFRRPVLIAGIILAGAGSMLLTGIEWVGFERDELNDGNLYFFIEYPSGYTSGYVAEAAEPFERKLLRMQGVERVIARYERERAGFFVRLEDSADAQEIVARIRQEQIRLGEAFLYFPGESGGLNNFPVVLSGPDPAKLKQLARQVAREVERLPLCRGTILHFKESLPAKQLEVELERMAASGIDPGRLRSQLHWMLRTPVLDKWTAAGREMDIVTRLGADEKENRSLGSVLRTPLSGTAIPLESLVRVGERDRVGRIYHLNRSRSVRLSVLSEHRRQRTLLSQTAKILDSFALPLGYRGQIGAEAAEQRVLTRTVGAGLLLAIVLTFLVLMFQFESPRVVAIIMLQIPGAFLCSLLLVRAFSWPLSLPVVIGLVLTEGIAVNNAILIFNAMGHDRMNLPLVCRTVSRKLQPLLVSSLTTIAGVAPLMFSGRAGRGILAPLSLTVAAGIAGSMVVLIATLSITAVRE